jgi:hypothetical protein
MFTDSASEMSGRVARQDAVSQEDAFVRSFEQVVKDRLVLRAAPHASRASVWIRWRCPRLTPEILGDPTIDEEGGCIRVSGVIPVLLYHTAELVVVESNHKSRNAPCPSSP